MNMNMNISCNLNFHAYCDLQTTLAIYIYILPVFWSVRCTVFNTYGHRARYKLKNGGK